MLSMAWPKVLIVKLTVKDLALFMFLFTVRMLCFDGIQTGYGAMQEVLVSRYSLMRFSEQAKLQLLSQHFDA